MAIQKGIYNLYKQGPSVKQKLSIIGLTEDKSGYEISFTDVCERYAILSFYFTDIRGYIAKFLVTERVYFPVVILCDDDGKNQQVFYLYATDQKEQFLLKSCKQLQDRIFLYLPPGSPENPAIYTYNCNLNGSFFVHGKTLDSSTLAEFNSELTDLIFIRKMGEEKPFNHKKKSCNCKAQILARDCKEECTGKKCMDDSGCGLPCGCPPGKICLESGECIGDKSIKPLSPPICSESSPCGSQNGSCFGSCPNGFECVKDSNNNFFCKQINLSKGSMICVWIAIILIILAFVVAFIVFWCFWNKRYRKCEQARSEIETSP